MLSRRSSLVRLAATATAALQLSGCTSWYPYHGSPPDLLEKEHPRLIRVILADSTKWQVTRPAFEDGNLTGHYSYLGKLGLTPRSPQQELRTGRIRMPGSQEPKLDWRSDIEDPRNQDGSSIWHSSGAVDRKDATRPRRAVPLDSVRVVGKQSINAGNTALLVLGVGIVTVAFLAAIVSASMSDTEPITLTDDTDWGTTCPTISSRDGTRWSTEGLLFAGSIHPALARTDRVVIRAARPDSGRVSLRFVGQPRETEYLDRLTVLAVEHAAGTDLAQTSSGEIVELGWLAPPTSAMDNFGRDVQMTLASTDGLPWESSLRARAPNAAPLDWIDLTFERPAGAMQARLVVRGCDTYFEEVLLDRYISAHGDSTEAWYAGMAAAPECARLEVGSALLSTGLGVSIGDERGWRPVSFIPPVGDEAPRICAVPLDLAHVTGKEVHVRLDCIPSMWLIDQVGVDFTPGKPLSATEVQPVECRSQADGRDLHDLLASADGRAVVLNAGDRITLEFAALAPAPCRAINYVVEGEGWYRVHVPVSGAPDRTLLQRVSGGREAVARLVLEERGRLIDLAAAGSR